LNRNPIATGNPNDAAINCPIQLQWETEADLAMAVMEIEMDLCATTADRLENMLFEGKLLIEKKIYTIGMAFKRNTIWFILHYGIFPKSSICNRTLKLET